jgi:hypothetical protein
VIVAAVRIDSEHLPVDLHQKHFVSKDRSIPNYSEYQQSGLCPA